MAASEAILSSWKTPFSTPIRKDENACRDLFQNSEKLLASAVSICRLKGSVECQTGGLITVCEELQSLIRLAFTEIRRLEKDFSAQKIHLEDEVNCLKERIKYLEEARGAKKFTEKQEQKTVSGDEKNDCQESKEAVDSTLCTDTNYSPSAENDNLEESDPYIFEVGNTEVSAVPVEDTLCLKDKKVSNSPPENKKLNSNKRLKKLSSKKSGSLSTVINGSDAGDQQIVSATSSVQEIVAEKQRRRSESTEDTSYAKSDDQDNRNQKKSSSNEQAAEPEECSSKFKPKGAKRASSRSKEMEESKEVSMDVEEAQVETTKESETGCTEEVHKNNKDKAKVRKKKSSKDHVHADDENEQNDLKESKKTKKKRSSAAEQESDDVFQAESNGNKSSVNTEPKNESPVLKKPKESLSKKLSCGKKTKAVFEESVIKASEKIEDEKSETECASAGDTDGTNSNSANKQLPDEPLGDMTFLINVNSQISVFVSNGSLEECELQPMTARERNDVYKMAQLYKLRARIGTKSENNLTTVRLSKQADTRMPKPGKVDCLLSELSMAALKKGVKDSPKNQGKRKYAAVADGSECSLLTACTDDDHDQEGPPRKKITKLSRAKKVKS